MLLHFSVYDFYYLAFVQLIVSTVLVLAPARGIGTRYRWTGSRITEVFVGGLGTTAVAAVSCWLTHEIWGLSYDGLETSACALVVIAVVVMMIQSNINFIGQVLYASFLAASFIFIVYAAYIAILASHSILESLTSSAVILLDAAAFFLWMSNINYSSDVLCRARRGRPLPKADPGYQPFVSLHVPAYNEPPELLIETIKALEAIDYPNYEVVIIDNNTSDPAVWEPVARYCEGRERVKFIHVAPWPGYKAGACNLVLRQYTDPRAEIIGLIDADDIVQPHYLREVAPYFSDPSIGFVQTFEGNRDFQLPGLRGLLPGLLPVGHVLAQRAQHGPVRGHDGAVPAQRAGSGGRLERVVHLRGYRGLAPGDPERLGRPLHPPLLRPGCRAPHLPRDADPAAPLVLRGHADPPAALEDPHAMGPFARQPHDERAAP